MSVIEFNPQPVQQKFLNTTNLEDPSKGIDIVFFGGGGGGGKSWSILVDNLRFIDDPNYFSIFFRRTNTELEQGLWLEAVKMYRPLLQYQDGPNKGKWIGQAKIREKDKVIVFPSGARSKFTYMQYDKDADSHYGSEYSRIYWDEFQMFSEYQFHVLRSRNRSRAKVKAAMRMTLNPDPDHFMYEWIQPFIDEEGYPDKDLGGRTRYFLIVRGELHTSWDLSELKDKFPDKNPKTYTYIPANLDDNKVLMELEPDYKDNLDSLPEKKRKQLLLGCWERMEDTGVFFQREWLREVVTLPPKCKIVRGWDKAHVEPSETYRYPDYTASIKMAKDRQGNIYLMGDYHPTCKDKDTNVLGRFRRRSGERNKFMLAQARLDGTDCEIVLPKDPGGGIVEFEESCKMFAEEGFVVRQDPVANNKSKVDRFAPFAAAAENGLVHILTNTFDKDTLDAYLTELESLVDERSTSRRKDDWADATASAYNYICRQRVYKCVVRNQQQSDTLAKEVLDNYDT